MSTSAPVRDAAGFSPEEITFEVLEGDPYELYERMRVQRPVVYAPVLDMWLVSTWDECARIAALTDAHRGGNEEDEQFFGRPNVLSMNGDEHRQFRAGVDAELRPRAVRGYVDELARQTVIDYIERIRERGRADLTTELFERISVRVIGDKLGLTDVDDDTLVRWFKTLSTGLETFSRQDEEAARAAAAAAKEIDDYLRARTERLREQPDSSIMSHMLHTGTADGTPRSYEEILPTIKVIILGGFQEPGNAVANTFAALLDRPEQLARLAAAPAELASAALQEGLRWLAPIGTVERTTVKPIETAWGTIPPGADLVFLVAAANRDRARFEHADEYDIDRMLLPNATFGYGEHFCAGHALARSLGEIMIEETVRRLPGLRPDPEGERVTFGFVFRGVKRLPALWDVK